MRDCLGNWVLVFLYAWALASNNIAALWAIRQGLMLALASNNIAALWAIRQGLMLA